MLNLMDASDELKGWGDNDLLKEMEQPSGKSPQFLVYTELRRRKDMRKRYQEDQAKAPPMTMSTLSAAMFITF